MPTSSHPTTPPLNHPDSRQNPPEPATPTDLNSPILTSRASPSFANTPSESPPIENQKSKLENSPSPLSPKQLTAISLLLAGRSVSTTAASLHLDRHTVSHWKNHHPHFKAELHRRTSEIWDTAHARLRQMLLTSLDIINRRLHDPRYDHNVDTAHKLLPILTRHGSIAPPQLPDPDALLDAALDDQPPTPNA